MVHKLLDAKLGRHVLCALTEKLSRACVAPFHGEQFNKMMPVGFTKVYAASTAAMVNLILYCSYNAHAHRERPNRDFSDLAKPQAGSDAVARRVRPPFSPYKLSVAVGGPGPAPEVPH